MAARAWSWMAVLLLASGCAASPPEPPPAPVQPTDARANDARVGVAVTRAPAQPAIDGDLAEWGPLPSPPAGIPSHLAVALGAEGALVAGELAGAARAGVWLGIGFTPASLPRPGQYMGNVGYHPVGGGGADDCATAPKLTPDGEGYSIETLSPAAVAACQAELSRHRDREAKHARRFSRMYRIDPEGVRLLGEDSRLTPVAGARSVFRPGAGGTRMEASLPLNSLPRVAEAPLETVHLAARAAITPEPPGPDAGVSLKLPVTVSFEPLGALRAHAFRRALDYGVAGPDGFGMTSYRLPRALSYQPADPFHIEVVDSRDCLALTAREVPLYEKRAALGDVEVGYAAAPRGNGCAAEVEPWVAIFVKGKLAGVEPTGQPRGAFLRGSEIHVLSFTETPSSPTGGAWSVLVVAPDGSHHAGVVEPVAGLHDPGGKAPWWDTISDFMAQDGKSFGWRGATGKRGLEATWTWDEASRTYRGKARPIPPPRKKPRR